MWNELNCRFVQPRIVAAIYEHIIAKEVPIRIAITVSIDESTEGGIVVSGLEIVEARLGIIVITAVTQRVHVCKAAGGAQDASIRIIGVAGYVHPGGVDQMDDVTLEVQNIIVRIKMGSICIHRSHIQHIGLAALVIQEIQGIFRTVIGVRFPQQLSRRIGVIVPDTIHNLIGAQTVYVVVITDAVCPVACRCKLPPILPDHGPGGKVAYTVEAGWIARTVVDIAAREAGAVLCAGDGSQQIQPISIAIGIIDAFVATHCYA